MIVKRSNIFIKKTEKIRDKLTKERLWKHIIKIKQNPEIAPFLIGENFKGIRKVYMQPYRILYRYNKQEDILEFLYFGKRDNIYKKSKR